jgi:hypothetical protein
MYRGGLLLTILGNVSSYSGNRTSFLEWNEGSKTFSRLSSLWALASLEEHVRTGVVISPVALKSLC